MKQLKLILGAFIFMFAFAGPIVAVSVPTPVAAACDGRVLGIPPWYRGLTTGSGEDCVIASPEQAGGISQFVLKLALNIIEMGIIIVGYIAIFFILYGGFQFLTGGANPGQVEKARNTILHAVIGLAIALAAVAILNIIFGLVL